MTIHTITVTQEDLSAAPAWVHLVLQQWAPADQYPFWEVQLHVSIEQGRPLINFDLVTVGSGVLATGELPAMFRHVSKDNVAVITKGSLLVPDPLGALPWFLDPKGCSVDLEYMLRWPDEMAWLLDISPETISYLATLQPQYQELEPLPAEALATIEEMNPGIRDTWESNYLNAITAVNLL